MENLRKIKTHYTCILLLILCLQLCNAQKSDLYIYEYEGSPYLEVNDSIKTITKGALINKDIKLIMNRDDVVQLINEKGDVFELYETGTFKHKQLLKLKPLENNTSFAQIYFSYIWKEFTNTIKTRRHKSGVVYRGDYIRLTQPIDSVELYTSEIYFEWEAVENKIENYYFIIREVGTDKLTQIGTKTNSLTLFVDNDIITSGKHYEWAVVETKYPNLKKIVYNRFKVLTEKEFGLQKEELESISAVLTELGLNNDQIKDTLCEVYKKCY